MFKIFKRTDASPSKQSAKPAARKPSSATRKPSNSAPAPLLQDPAPVPEVVEGNDHTDWALWEDSMTVLDSQMQSITPSARIYEKDKRIPSQFDDLDSNDAFSKVGKNRDH